MIQKLIFSLLLLISFSSIATAQGEGRKEQMKERVKSLKIAFLTSELQLSPEESKAFWPLYEAHEAKVETLNKSIKGDKPIEDLSEAEAKALIEKYIAIEKEKLKSEEMLLRELTPIIGAQRVIRLKKSDEKFKRKLLERAKENRGGGQGRRGGRE